MDDFYFENELKNRKRTQVNERFDSPINLFSQGDSISNKTQEILQKIQYALDWYYERKYKGIKSDDEILDMAELFKDELTDEKLSQMYNKHQFSQEELEYFKLARGSFDWKDFVDCGAAGYAIREILVRKKIMDTFGTNALETFRDIIQNEMRNTSKPIKDYCTQFFSDNPWGKDIHQQLEEYIEKETEALFNQAINCGGYALKVDTCVWPTGQNFDETISSFLENFQFIRLLGDRPLEEDEYLVIYRAPDGKNTGHHFIRVDSDAIVREKDGSKEPKIFENWGNLAECREAIFAVKKEHDMFGYWDEKYDVINKYHGVGFEASAGKAIRERKNSFSYHNHEFQLKKSNQDEVFVTSVEGEKVAYVLVEEDEIAVEVFPEKQSYVDNYKGQVEPIIVNGKLINFDDFKSKKVNQEIERK